MKEVFLIFFFLYDGIPASIRANVAALIQALWLEPSVWRICKEKHIFQKRYGGIEFTSEAPALSRC